MFDDASSRPCESALADPDSLDEFDRQLIAADPATLTDRQLARRDKLLGDHRQAAAEIDRRRTARRDANRLATRLAGSLGIHHLLTPAPARAFYELVRKFAKDRAAGRAPIYEQARECLAADAGVSVSAFDAMRRIAVAQGWITAAVSRVQEAGGRWRQEPTVYPVSACVSSASSGLRSSLPPWPSAPV